MPTSYSTLLGLALPVTGELSGTWGDEVNNYITQYLDSAVAGVQTISGSQTAVTLSRTTNAALSQAGSGSTGSSQYQIINCTGNPASALTITVPSTSKVYVVLNNTSTNQTVTVKPSAAAGVTVAAARAALIAWNGTDFELVATDDASKMNGVLAAANGGTGQSSYTVGDILFASGTTTLSKLADVATGNALISGGVGVAPSYGKIGLTTHVSGTLPIANGGTNATATPTGGAVAYGTGTAYAFTSAGTSGQVLTSAGASAPTWTTATNANTASAIVQRDASGNFSAGTITATLSGSATQVSNSLTLATSGTGLSGSATFNGSSAQTFTVTSNATSANTASTIVARDASGNFSAGTITAALSGNATTATTATQVSNSLTLATSGTGLSGSATFNGASAQTFTVTSNATSANTASTIVARDASGNFSAGTITATLSGNATNVSGTVAVANGGTGATTAPNARTNLGATTVGSNLFTLTNPSAVTFPRFNADNTVSALDAATFRSAIGAGTGSGTVTSVATTGTVNGITLTGGTITSSGTITLGGTLSGVSLTTQVTGTLPVANGGTGVTTSTGSGNNVLSTSPTLVTPILGTPTSGTLSNCTVDGTNGVGYINLPQVSQSAAYTLVLSDAGKHIFHPSADTTARTWTIPANSSVAFPIGTAVTFINQNGAGVITIAITSDTMRLAGAGTTGSRTLAANGVATAVKITSTEWIISGTGLT